MIFRTLCVFLAGFSLCFVGCESKTDARLKELNGTQIQRLSNCYCFCQSSSPGLMGPKDEAAFREFLSDPRHKKGFDRLGVNVEDLDALLTSERDGQPYKIKFGLKGSPFGFNEAIIFETEGVDGEVMVGFGGSTTELMSLEESVNLFESKANKKKKVVRSDNAG